MYKYLHKLYKYDCTNVLKIHETVVTELEEFWSDDRKDSFCYDKQWSHIHRALHIVD